MHGHRCHLQLHAPAAAADSQPVKAPAHGILADAVLFVVFTDGHTILEMTVLIYLL
jgi:hypothetical protein